MKKFSLFIWAFWSTLGFCAPMASGQRVHLAPQLHSGQTLFYRIDFSVSRSTRTESRVASPQLPPTARLAVSGILQVEVVAASANGLQLKTYFSERESAPLTSTQSNAPAAAADIPVEVSIAPNGVASQLKGYERLSVEQKAAWTDWLSRFTTSMTFPHGGPHRGQKWQREESETTPAPIAGLTWSKKFQYVHDEPCPKLAGSSSSMPNQSSLASEPCAVILVRAKLRQKSPTKDSTPQDYKLNNLKTRGIVSGQNETILYISRSSGLLVRATEDAQQSMDVSIALSDGSNQLHSSLTAKSRSEIVLLPDSPL